MQKFDVQSLLKKLSELGVRPNKKLGQNFLINQNVCEKITQEALKHHPKHIVEVGPGLGALTEILFLNNIPITLIELDRSFAEYWQQKGFKVFHADALKLDWKELDLPQNTLLLSNLPYQISSCLVIERSIDPQNINQMVLMFQKEVAQRIMAKPKTEDYGLLTVVAQTFWKIDMLMEVGPKDFYPPPQIASRVLVFSWRKTQIEQPKKFLNFAKAAFAQRRKFLVSNLAQIAEKNVILRSMQDVGISEQSRAEDLSVEQFQELYTKIQNM